MLDVDLDKLNKLVWMASRRGVQVFAPILGPFLLIRLNSNVYLYPLTSKHHGQSTLIVALV